MDKFIENENKELLWDILYEQGLFNNIPLTECNNIKFFFENQLRNISHQYNLNNPNITLVELNTLSIKIISENIDNFKLKYSLRWAIKEI